jgi:hypothetical protein
VNLRHRSDSSSSSRLCVALSALAIVSFTGASEAATKVACAGEQTTHSAHRQNDPEYPLLLGKLLDPGFTDSGKMALYGGGFVEGSGPLFTLGNFAHPQGTVLVHDLTDPKTYTKSDEYQQLRAFAPDLVVLGPFGWHETLAKVPLSGFTADYDKLIDSVRGIASQPRVVLVTPVPESGVDKKDGFNEIDGYVRATAKRRELPMIDVWTEFLGKSQLYQDDFHLNLEGRTHLAEVIGQSVKELASEPGSSGGVGGGGNAGGSAGATSAGAGGSSGQAAVGGGASVAGSGGADRAGSGGAAPVAGAAGSGGAATPLGGSPGAQTGGDSATTTNNTTAPAQSSSCSYPVQSKTSPLALGLVLLGLLRRKRRA